MRILLVKTSSLGDVVHNLPVVSDIRRALPEAEIHWLVEESFQEIPALHPAVSRVIPVAIRRWRKNLLSAPVRDEIRAFRRTLRSQCYDLVLDTQGLVKSALLARQARLCGHGFRFGHGPASAREPLASWAYQRSINLPNDWHAVLRNRGLAAAALGLNADLPLDYGLRAQPLEADWLPPTGKPYITLLTATSRDDKLWPENHWVALGLALAEQGWATVLPAGSPAERERAARLCAQIPGAVAAPPLGITPLARLFAGSDAIIGLDTGLTHLAAALHRPTLALFTGSDPLLTGVYGGPGAINLGARGVCPSVAEVLDALGLARQPVCDRQGDADAHATDAGAETASPDLTP